RGQCFLFGESQSQKLPLFRPIAPTLYLSLPPSSPKSAPLCSSPTPLLMVVPRSCTACLRRVAASDDFPPATAISNNVGLCQRLFGHMSRLMRNVPFFTSLEVSPFCFWLLSLILVVWFSSWVLSLISVF